ncbi:hypothetical protein [Pedobacter gandavensis]|uniref:hypothetical protein n=1 Tax=Pedobacter gandavensis TaxID=2679963 RepID=UPI00292E5DFC|nr:hypothetical protein [Pedobacter gandavensis]
MKRLFIALVCTAMGFSAMASEVSPAKTQPLSKKALDVKVLEVKAPETKAVEQSKIQKRKTTKYVFHLTCGDVIVNVYNDAVNVPGVMSGIWNHFNDQNCK